MQTFLKDIHIYMNVSMCMCTHTETPSLIVGVCGENIVYLANILKNCQALRRLSC